MPPEPEAPTTPTGSRVGAVLTPLAAAAAAAAADAVMAATVRGAGPTAAVALVVADLVVLTPSPLRKLLPPKVATNDDCASRVDARALAMSAAGTADHAYVSAYCTRTRARGGGAEQRGARPTRVQAQGQGCSSRVQYTGSAQPRAEGSLLRAGMQHSAGEDTLRSWGAAGGRAGGGGGTSVCAGAAAGETAQPAHTRTCWMAVGTRPLHRSRPGHPQLGEFMMRTASQASPFAQDRSRLGRVLVGGIFSGTSGYRT
jgi:hypothetical protein